LRLLEQQMDVVSPKQLDLPVHERDSYKVLHLDEVPRLNAKEGADYDRTQNKVASLRPASSGSLILISITNLMRFHRWTGTQGVRCPCLWC
jgi:hypothetical protein